MNTKMSPLVEYWLSDKNNRPLFMEMINEVIKVKDYSYALSLIDQAPVEFGADIRLLKVDILLAMGNQKDAAVELDKVPASVDDQQRYNYYKAKIAFLNGQLDVVLAHLQKSTNKLNSDGLVLKARTEYLSGSAQTASKTLLNIESIEHDSEALGLSAMVAVDLADYQQADKYCAWALHLNPSQPDALLAKATILLYFQNPTDADFCIKQFLSQLPTSGRGWSVQGQASLMLTDLNTSLSELKTAVQLMPEHIGTWHLLAWNYYLLGLLDHAEQSFVSALNLDQAFADSYGGLAVIAAAKGDVEVAQKNIKLASRLSKSSFSAEYAKALLENASGNETGAIARIEQLLTQNSHLDNFTYRELIKKVVELRANE